MSIFGKLGLNINCGNSDYSKPSKHYTDHLKDCNASKFSVQKCMLLFPATDESESNYQLVKKNLIIRFLFNSMCKRSPHITEDTFMHNCKKVAKPGPLNFSFALNELLLAQSKVSTLDDEL
jgi:hypothetical protein